MKRAIPFDPCLHFGLQAAEQFLYSARLYTHGCDVYTPTRHTVATEYLTNRQRIDPDAWQQHCRAAVPWREATWSKVKYLLGLDELAQVDARYRDQVRDDVKRYGMGSARSLPDYYHYTGLHGDLLSLFPFYGTAQGGG